MNRRDTVCALLALAAASRLASSFAQSVPGKVVRVGVLSVSSRASSPIYLLAPAALGKIGWVEGKNIFYEWRFADGRPAELPRLASELVQLNPDVIVVPQNFEAEAVLRATHTIPLVITAAFDPVGAGFAQTLAHPGGSVTGLLYSDPGIVAKADQIFFEAVPTVRRLGLLYDARYPRLQPYTDADESAAKAANVEVRKYPVRSSEDSAVALAMIKKEQVDGIKVAMGGVVSIGMSTILDSAAEQRLPTAWGQPGPVERGGLLSYAPRFSEIADRSAALVDKILKGAKPADIPFEYPTRYELTINLKTAKALGIKIPQTVLLRADRLIE